MTENLAGRGEGLAGLANDLGRAARELHEKMACLSRWPDRADYAAAFKPILETALEAAAPAGTAPTRERSAQAICEFHQRSRWSKEGETIYYAEADWILAMPEFALATPSPQAPTEPSMASERTIAIRNAYERGKKDGAQPQASSEIREALEELCSMWEAEKETEHPTERSKWYEMALMRCARDVRALAPSRQGAGGK